MSEFGVSFYCDAVYMLQSVSFLLFTPPPIGERSIVMTVSVCLSVREHIFGTTCPIFTNFVCMLGLIMSVVRSSGGVAIRYVLPVLWMTSRLYTKARNRRHNSDSIETSMNLSPWRILKLTHQGQHRTGGGVWYLRLPGLAVLLWRKRLIGYFVLLFFFSFLGDYLLLTYNPATVSRKPKLTIEHQ